MFNENLCQKLISTPDYCLDGWGGGVKIILENVIVTHKNYQKIIIKLKPVLEWHEHIFI